MKATQAQIAELAAVIATQAQAIADGTIMGPLTGAVARLTENVATLKAWTQEVHQ